MINNKLFIAMITTGYCALILMVSCETHNQKSEEAFNRFKKEKLMAKVNPPVMEVKAETPRKAEVIKKIVIEDEWTLFINRTGKNIRANENNIKAVKGIKDVNLKLIKKVIRLEKENDNLKGQLANFHQESKEKTNKFITKMNEDVKTIEIKLEEILLKAKK